MGQGQLSPPMNVIKQQSADNIAGGFFVGGGGGGMGYNQNNGINPLTGAIDPHYASVHGANAGLAGQQAQASASMQNAFTTAMGGLLGTKDTNKTNFQIADLQNAGQNFRTVQELETALKKTGMDNETAKAIAQMQYSSQNYAADKGLQGTQVQADANKYGSQVGAQAQMYGANQQNQASQYGSLAGLLGTQYTANAQSGMQAGQNATNLGVAKMQSDASVAPTQAKIFTFNQMLPIIKDILKRQGMLS